MKDLTGQQFGRYTVLRRAGSDRHRNSLWECQCSCGKVRVKRRTNLVTGNSKSCGCLRTKKVEGPPPPSRPGCSWIKLTRGQWCLVDNSDYDLASKYEWSFSSGYARRNRTRDCPSNFLHRLLMDEPQGQVDHINGIRWDNRRCNLRLASDTQNKWNKAKRRDNTSGFKGVTWHTQSGRWRAEIAANGIRLRRSGFPTPEAAHRQYAEWSKQLHGEFARP